MQPPHAVAMVLEVLAPREMVEYGSDPWRPLVADTACARIFPARGIAHIPAQSSHLSLVRVRALPEVAAWRSPCRPPGDWVRGLGLRGD